MNKPDYNVSNFDESYYGQGGHGGFRSYDYHSPEQQEQLAIKYDFWRQLPHMFKDESTLFVGCARGYEVAHWLKNGNQAYGMDVSKWAIQNQIAEASGRCTCYDGRNLPLHDNMMSSICCFDVLTLLPDDVALPLISDMCRVARKGIVWRSVVKNWRNMDTQVDGQDGVHFVYRPFEFWDKAFSQSGKFRLHWLKMHHQYEVTALYTRNQ